MRDDREIPDRVVYATPHGRGFMVSRLDGSETFAQNHSEVWGIVHDDDDVWMRRVDVCTMLTRVVWKERP